MKILFNPFEKFRESQLLICGTIITAAGWLLGYFFRARFDGVIDLHFVDQVSLFAPLTDLMIDILAASLVFFVAGIILNRKTRYIDLLATAVIARTPLYLLTIFNAGGMMSATTNKMTDNIKTDPFLLLTGSEIILMVVFGLLSLALLVWQVVLLYNGYRVASNARGTKAVLIFITAFIIAEVISKIFINQISVV
jgi:hypothetical protein